MINCYEYAQNVNWSMWQQQTVVWLTVSPSFTVNQRLIGNCKHWITAWIGSVVRILKCAKKHLWLLLFLVTLLQRIVMSMSVCLCVCLSVCLHNWTWLNFTQFFVNAVCGHGSVLLWWHCYTLCTSGFMDDVMFSYHGTCGTDRHDVV